MRVSETVSKCVFVVPCIEIRRFSIFINCWCCSSNSLTPTLSFSDHCTGSIGIFLFIRYPLLLQPEEVYNRRFPAHHYGLCRLVRKSDSRRHSTDIHLSRPFLVLKQTQLKTNLYNLRIKMCSCQRADMVKHLFLRPGRSVWAI